MRLLLRLPLLLSCVRCSFGGSVFPLRLRPLFLGQLFFFFFFRPSCSGRAFFQSLFFERSPTQDYICVRVFRPRERVYLYVVYACCIWLCGPRQRLEAYIYTCSLYVGLLPVQAIPFFYSQSQLAAEAFPSNGCFAVSGPKSRLTFKTFKKNSPWPEHGCGVSTYTVVNRKPYSSIQVEGKRWQTAADACCWWDLSCCFFFFPVVPLLFDGWMSSPKSEFGKIKKKT